MLSVVFATMLIVASAALLPVVPRSTAAPGTWATPETAACGGRHSYCGDVRAVLNVQSSDIDTRGATTAQIYWRRRDPNPNMKTLLVTTMGPTPVVQVVLNASISGLCGVVSFTPSGGPGTYVVYFMPFAQSNGGAWTNFNWLGCNDTSPKESNKCVLGATDDMCVSATAASGLVVTLENRDDFNAFTEMESMASPAEVAATSAALVAAGAPFVGVFPEPRELSVRVFDVTVPARWTPGHGPHTPGQPSFSATVVRGEWFAFQLGLWEYKGSPVTGIGATTAGLTAAASPPIPPEDIYFVNVDGVDISGNAFKKDYGIPANGVGSLWVGVVISPAAEVGAVYTGAFILTTAANASVSISVPISLTVSAAPAVANGGTADITKLGRLSWLYSTRGLDDTVPKQFVPVTVASKSPLTIQTNFRTIYVGDDGLPIDVMMADGPNLFRAPLSFTVFDTNHQPIPSTVTIPAYVTSETQSSISWTARSSLIGGLVMTVTGAVDFSSYMNFNVSITNDNGGGAQSVSDMQLAVYMDPQTLRYMCGMGIQGSKYHDATWRWSNTTGANKIWLGRVEAGVVLNLKGDGLAWDSPMFGGDYPVIPFVPPSWGGASAMASGNPNGVNIVGGNVTTPTGPRAINANEGVHFLFDLALTPSKRVDQALHWKTRSVQVGYGTDYLSPQTVKGMGATVVTLHQGIPGIVNGSMVNPYISYPFGDDVVPLLTNYTSQANALGMATKFYYTIRELSTRATESFAFLAQQGELFLDQDPYLVVQPGYAQGWDNHGGSAYLHQHMVSHYAACWQASLSNGEWDPSACDHGISRLFNFYLEGLWWSFSQQPYINGVYYDGINFPRQGMIRIRRTADAAAIAANSSFPALLDLHTGRDPTPPTCSYASHYPMIDYIWNGEGFDYSQGPSYWLVEVSSRLHGVTGDLLGAGHNNLWRGMLFGMTDRNADWSSQLWKFWDNVTIGATTMVGWWETAPVVVSAACPSAPDAEHSEVLATVYTLRGSHAVVSIASWCPAATTATLTIDWPTLGMNAGSTTVTAPAIEGVQPAQIFPTPSGPYNIPPSLGIILLFSSN